MKRTGSILAFAAVTLLAVRADAARRPPFSAPVPSSPGKQGPVAPGGEPPGDPVSLVVDDGGLEDCLGLTVGGQFFWLNRFTPVEYPVGLTQIQILWGTICNIAPGATFDLFTYRDNDSDPANGAVNTSSHVNNVVTTIGSFQTIPVVVTFLPGPGDVLIGAVNRTGMSAVGQFPAAIDQTTSQVRSWAGFGGNPPVPPPVPFGTFGTIDSFQFPGNWLIRGSGTVVPVELQDFTIH